MAVNRDKVLAELREKLENRNMDPSVQAVLEQVADAQQANCHRVLFDCCHLTLSPESVIDLPNGLINIYADYFFLECCSNPTTIDGITECGTLVNACTAQEVKAIGNINYVTSFNAPTFYNNGAADCNRTMNHTFSCASTLCVNHTLCYTTPDTVDPCPEFCNGNVLAFAYISDVDYCNPSKAVVTISVIFILPECENDIPVNN